MNKTIVEVDSPPRSRNNPIRGGNPTDEIIGATQITESSVTSNPLKQYMTIKTARMTTQHVMSLKIGTAKPSQNDSRTSRNLNIFQNEDLEHLEIESSEQNYTKRSSLVNHL